MIRKDLNDQIYRTEKEKDIAIVKLVEEKFNLGQPILISLAVLINLNIILICLKKKLNILF